MAVSKCLKCGTDIPEGAEFCPSCGTPKGAKVVTKPVAQPMQPQQPMYQQQPMVKTGDPLKNLAQTLFSTKLMVIFIMIGLLLIFIGMFIWTFGYPGYESMADMKSQADVKDYIESYGILKIASLITSLGFFALSSTLLCGGLVNNKLNGHVRLAIILAGAWILASTLSGSALDPGNFLPWNGF